MTTTPPSIYTITATREQRTTCGQHRTLGYALIGGRMVCRGCFLSARLHESTSETATRKAGAR